VRHAHTASSARTTTSYAILGLLSVRDWSTYELAKQVRRSLRWFWPRTERKLYDEPKRLVADGLATATKQYTGQRPRTVYGITEQGREQLRRWLDEPPATRSMEFEGMLKLFFSDSVSPQLRLDNIRAKRLVCERKLAQLRALEPHASSGPEGPYLTLQLGIRMQECVIDWCRTTEQALMEKQ